jgi:homocysteine S-methyltransferase
MSDKIQELLKQDVVIADGAMGTMLYQKGVFLNSCFDEINLTKPDMVKEIHQGYVQAGSDFIETNTFGANHYKLGKFGLGNKVEEINEAAVKIAREAAGDQALVAGAMGPIGHEVAPYGKMSTEEAAGSFRQQANALAAAGVDFIVLETFDSTQELLLAVRTVAEATSLPIFAQITLNQDGETIYGKKISKAVEQLAAEPSVVAAGLNCSVGPSEMLDSLEIIRTVTDKPIIISPNAGLPRQVENRTLYMCTPEYMAEYAKRFFEKGAKVIGGCCGTTPDHILEVAKAVRGISKATAKVKEVAPPAEHKKSEQAEPQDAVPLEERSSLGKKLTTGEMITCVEITPPRGIDLDSTLEKAQLCADVGVDCINLPDGPRASSRISPMVTAVKIQEHVDIETVLHYCCRDRNLIGMQSDMLGASAIGLHNILIVTGDPPKLGKYPDATGVFDMDSVGFTGVMRNLNHGIDIGGNSFSPPVYLTIGVGANPVAADMEREIERFKLKVKSGAEYAVTQPIFDPESLEKFLEAVEGYQIPIIAGIWPFASYKNAEFMANEVPGVVVPEELLDKMSKAKTKEEGKALGIEIAQDIMEKIKPYVQGYAVSAPFGNVKTALAALGKFDSAKI